MQKTILDLILSFLGLNLKSNFKTVELINNDLFIPKTRLRQKIDINNHLIIDYQLFSNIFTLDKTFFYKNICYGDLLDIIPLNHDKYYKKDNTFNKIKNIKFLCFIIQGYDKTDLKFYFFNEKDKILFRNINKVKSYRYKANIKKRERTLLNQIRYNNHYKYSYNFNYIDDILSNIDNINNQIDDLKSSIDDIKSSIDDLNESKDDYIKYRNLVMINIIDKQINDKIYHLQDKYNQIDDLKQDLTDLNKLYDNLTYSLGNDDLNQITISNDYFNQYKNSIKIDDDF